MQVILLERIEKLGFMGDEVAVKPGFARNYLLPQKKALRATKANREYFEAKRAELEARNLERKREAERAAEKVQGMTVTMIRQAGETGQLYGSVTARDIADSLADQGAHVERGQVDLGRQIKTIGLHPVGIRLHPEVTVEVTVNVARSQGEADSQIEAGRTVSVEEQEQIADQAVEEVISEVEQLETETDTGAESGSESEQAAERA
jgi:large subunit ribosomal protein L9